MEFYNNLNLENISEEDHNHGKRIYRDFEIKNLGEYHDLYLRSDVLLPADAFENFQKICFDNQNVFRLNQIHICPRPSMAGSF